MAVDTTDVAQLARIGKALSDPIRLKMLGILAEGRECCDLPDLCTRNVPGSGTPAGICVCEFQEQFGLGQSRTSYHLRVLKEAGLVKEELRGKWTFYELDRETLASAMSLLQGLAGE
ncbi:MAG TPA: metalloregulator ArsR/SmtB family transcription factor [Thermoleophilia bacterium]|nr:metalloregulator ArsR/SmtB family transcription factor [Thermoleophilia bacterium]